MMLLVAVGETLKKFQVALDLWKTGGREGHTIKWYVIGQSTPYNHPTRSVPDVPHPLNSVSPTNHACCSSAENE